MHRSTMECVNGVRSAGTTALLAALVALGCAADAEPETFGDPYWTTVPRCAVIYAANYERMENWKADGVWAQQQAEAARSRLVAAGWKAVVVAVHGYDELVADLAGRAQNGCIPGVCAKCDIVSTVSHAGFDGPTLIGTSGDLETCVQQPGLNWPPGEPSPPYNQFNLNPDALRQLAAAFRGAMTAGGCAAFIGCNTGAPGTHFSGHDGQSFAQAFAARAGVCAVGMTSSTTLGRAPAVLAALAAGRVPRGAVRHDPTPPTPQLSGDSIGYAVEDGGQCSAGDPAEECAGEPSCWDGTLSCSSSGGGPDDPPQEPPPWGGCTPTLVQCIAYGGCYSNDGYLYWDNCGNSWCSPYGC